MSLNPLHNREQMIKDLIESGYKGDTNIPDADLIYLSNIWVINSIPYYDKQPSFFKSNKHKKQKGK